MQLRSGMGWARAGTRSWVLRSSRTVENWPRLTQSCRPPLSTGSSGKRARTAWGISGMTEPGPSWASPTRDERTMGSTASTTQSGTWVR